MPSLLCLLTLRLRILAYQWYNVFPLYCHFSEACTLFMLLLIKYIESQLMQITFLGSEMREKKVWMPTYVKLGNPPY